MDALRWEFLGVALKNVKPLSLNYFRKLISLKTKVENISLKLF